MCVIIHTAKKNMLKRHEFDEAMRRNPSGFFIAELLKNGKRNILRTLSEEAATEFWSKIPDESEVVLHFRVPSKGETDLTNVHGWAQDKILFCHNRTLYSLCDIMGEENWKGTDSEYFFKKVFIPLYRKLGGYGKAYSNGKLCPLLERVVRGICGDYNKFLFIMPDNTVLRYGEWSGDDENRPGFHASNSSYMRLPEPSFMQMLWSWLSLN